MNELDNKCPECNQLLLPNAEVCWWCRTKISKSVFTDEFIKDIKKERTKKLYIIALKILLQTVIVFVIVILLIWGASFGNFGMIGVIPMIILSLIIIRIFGLWLDYKLFGTRNIIVRFIESIIYKQKDDLS